MHLCILLFIISNVYFNILNIDHNNNNNSKTEVAASTMMLKYIALSQAMQEILPFRKLLTEVKNIVGLSDQKTTEIHVLVSQPGRGFGNSWHHWCTYLNFLNMYDDIYDVLEENKLAVKLIEPAMMDGEGKIVTDTNKQVGRKVTHKFTHPENVYVFDEKGCNTSQENDRRRGNQNFICARGSITQKAGATKSNHFTTLGVTSLNGTPYHVLCNFC